MTQEWLDVLAHRSSEVKALLAEIEEPTTEDVYRELEAQLLWPKTSQGFVPDVVQPSVKSAERRPEILHAITHGDEVGGGACRLGRGVSQGGYPTSCGFCSRSIGSRR